MVKLLAPTGHTDLLKTKAREFLEAINSRQYAKVWNELITHEAASLISSAIFPAYAYRDNKVDDLISLNSLGTATIYALALAFQGDTEDMRTGFFSGIASGLDRLGWLQFDENDCAAFLWNQSAVLVASTPKTKLIMIFVEHAPNDYRVDLASYATFSMAVRASEIYKIAERCTELGRNDLAREYFELASEFLGPYLRIKALLWDHPVVRQFITEQRRSELEGELRYTMLARERAEGRTMEANDLYSVFISYGGPDEQFARSLYEALHKEGVTTFFFPEHATPGEKLHRLMRKGVNKHDRVILVCSRASLDRKGVLNEVEEVLAREAREGGASYLIPIRLDGYIFSEWKPPNEDVAQTIKDRVIADFEGALEDERKFQSGVRKLVAALRKR